MRAQHSYDFSIEIIDECLVTPLCSSTAKKTSIFNRSRSQNQNNPQRLPPPPPEFLSDGSLHANDKPVSIHATGSGLKDGLVDDHCQYTLIAFAMDERELNYATGHFDISAPDAELQKLVIAIDGPSKADIQIQIVESGIYRVYYKCLLPGRSAALQHSFEAPVHL